MPLVPAGIKGTDGLRRLARWRVRYGAPVAARRPRELEPAEAARIATERLMDAIRELEASL